LETAIAEAPGHVTTTDILDGLTKMDIVYVKSKHYIYPVLYPFLSWILSYLSELLWTREITKPPP